MAAVVVNARQSHKPMAYRQPEKKGPNFMFCWRKSWAKGLVLYTFPVGMIFLSTFQTEEVCHQFGGKTSSRQQEVEFRWIRASRRP